MTSVGLQIFAVSMLIGLMFFVITYVATETDYFKK